MDILNSTRQFVLVCPCGKSTMGIGLIYHLETKESWYRLHQKKCETCKPVRFSKLTCKVINDNFLMTSEINLQKHNLNKIYLNMFE